MLSYPSQLVFKSKDIFPLRDCFEVFFFFPQKNIQRAYINNERIYVRYFFSLFSFTKEWYFVVINTMYCSQKKAK